MWYTASLTFNEACNISVIRLWQMIFNRLHILHDVHVCSTFYLLPCAATESVIEEHTCTSLLKPFPSVLQVLATGLSGLYSSLPTKLEVPSEEWHCLHKEDWLQMPSLIQFLNSLEFCSAVIQVKTCARLKNVSTCDKWLD